MSNRAWQTHSPNKEYSLYSPEGNAHLYFVDELLLPHVVISAVNDINDVRVCSLHGGNGCPQNPFTTTSSIALMI